MILKLLYKIAFWSSLLGVIAFITDFGFLQSDDTQQVYDNFYLVVLGIGILSTAARYLEKIRLITGKVFIFDLVTILFTILLIYIVIFQDQTHQQHSILDHTIWIKLAVLLTFIREFSEVTLNYKRTLLDPSQLFITSFFLIILLGTMLLMLPEATHNGISFIDALFTATSAVCVTGLIVVDTSSYFTEFGQILLMILIQIGGLGILTFASYFSYFFKGGASYENQLVLSDMTNSNKLGDVFTTLKNILVITFGIELFSGILIYTSLNGQLFPTQYDQIFFSAFHAISAFCNAGFSTLEYGLYEEGFRFNYYLQMILILTFVIGGLGFPIVSNLIIYIRYRLRTLLVFGKREIVYKPWVLNLNSRITLITTMALFLLGFVFFYLIEYNNTLAEHTGFGKIVTALFGATTPRTAGFNTIDMGSMMFPTTILVILLMWIGASPASTGGGIKTSTFAIATLNILSLAKGKTRIEIFRREIADISVRRAFATISLSLIIIGLGILLLSIYDSDKDLKSIAFECFSAYSTVGLSLGITADLSNISKFVLVVVMFVGRVSMLTIVIAVFNKIKHKNYRYPTEEITIN